jgi:hypothetical protein
MHKLRRVWQLATQVNEQYQLGIARQLLEIFWLYLRRGIGPNYYYEAGLWSRQLSWQDRLSHTNSQAYKALVDRLNPAPYRKASQHKLLEKAVLTLAKVPTAEFVGFFHSEKGYDAQGRALRDGADLACCLAGFDAQRLCFKLVEGWGGTGFRLIEVQVRDNELTIQEYAQAPLVFADWFAQLGDWSDGLLIERYIVQHPVMRGLNADSVNTLRIWVKQSGPQTEIIGAIVRIGRQGCVVDNAGQGGFIAQLDIHTGRITQALSCEILPQRFAKHPDTGAMINGVQVPFWQQAQKVAIDALHAFPHTGFAGLDVAIGENGPIIVELNLQPDKVTARNFGRSIHQLLS